MRIAQVRSVWTRVPDPLRPGQHARAEKVVSAGATTISHPQFGSFTVGDDGVFDVPPEVASDLVGRVFPGEVRWLSEAEIPDDLVLVRPKAGKQK